MIYEKGGRIATVTLNRPEKCSALSRKLRDELDLVLDDRDATRIAGPGPAPGRPPGVAGLDRDPLTP